LNAGKILHEGSFTLVYGLELLLKTGDVRPAGGGFFLVGQ
jgi:hypothetical protein